MSEAPRKIWIYPESNPNYYEKPVEYAVYEGIEFIRADLYEAEIAALKQKFVEERKHAEWLQKQLDEDVTLIYERNAEKDKEINKERELTDKAWRAYAKRDKELQEALVEQRRRMGAEYDELEAELKRVREVAAEEIERLKDDIKAICDFVPEGFPMPLGWRELAWKAKEQAAVTKYIPSDIQGAEITTLRAELKQQFEESVSIINDQGAENIILKENLALNAKMLAHQTDLAREAETEAAKLRNALGVVQANYDIYTTALVKFAVDEVLK